MTHLSEEPQRVLTRLIARHAWIFAKTMPSNPHWYTLRRDWDDDGDFVWMVQLIREMGVDEMFMNKRYRVLYFDDWKYWTMGAPIDETILINRKWVGEGPPRPTELSGGR